MQQIKVNESVALRRRVPVLLTNSSGAPVAGVTSPTIYFSFNGEAINPVAGSWVEVGNGLYYYELSLGQTATPGFISIRISNTTPVVVTPAVFVQIVAFDPYTVVTNPNVNVASWGASALTVPDTVVDFPNAYRALIAIDFNATTDEWTIVLIDKDGPRSSGVTNVTLSIQNRSSGLTLGPFTMTAISGGSAFKYDATGSARIPQSETRIAIVNATIDGAIRAWRQGVARP